MHPQTLRQYDRLGLVRPKRTLGSARRYSLRDVAKLREVASLSSEGVNLEGISRIMLLEDRVHELEQRVKELKELLAEELIKRPGARVFAAGAEGEVITIKPGTRGERSNKVVIWRP
ncbi:MAG: MerR family transcriptional regulator [Microbacteriaceae bacterium]|nr:MerR family transcriptional regulator [Microbacteriaceae bacterium]